MKKQITFLLIATFAVINCWGQEPLLKTIEAKLKIYNTILPFEKVYVQFDRPFYKPGEDVWMAVWITNGITNKPSELSEMLTIEFINPQGVIEKSQRLLAANGRATCDFTLDPAAAGGIYKIKAYTNWMKNFGDENVFVKEIQIQKVELPRLLMKLDMERKAYGASDTVRGKLLLQTLENVPLSNFDFTYQVNLNGEEFQHSDAKTDNDGKALVTFVLPTTLQSADGILQVVISYKGNIESISRSIPIVLNQIDLQFFPEGGDLVTGTRNNLAFKGLNESGKPADIEGTVFNSKHEIVAKFKSYHHGMGAFRFTPQQGEKYYALIDRPQGIMQLYPLPQPVDNSYLMELTEPMQFIHPNAQQLATVRIVAPESTTVLLIAQVQGKIVYSSTLNVKKGENTISLPLAAFPCGLAQLTLFTKNSIEVCERLVFVKKNQQLKIDITTNKSTYLPREKVELLVKTSDANGKPIDTQMALAVVDDKLLSMADDKSDNILSYLLLSSEVKGKIEEPNFYFNPEESKADSALDYLLLTQAWRRFNWEKVVETSSSDLVNDVNYNQERRILCGQITGKSSSVVQMTRLYIKETGQTAKPDAKGYYEFKGLDLTTPLTLIAISENRDTIKTVINDYTSVKSSNNYYYDRWNGLQVQGTVKDKETGEPIPGVSIYVKGTSKGIASDFDGRFSLDANKKDILVISCMGYNRVEIVANTKTYSTILLEKEALRLDEVIVTAFGVERKRKIVGHTIVEFIYNNTIKVDAKQDNNKQQVVKKPLKPKVVKKETLTIKQNRGTTIEFADNDVRDVGEENIQVEEEVFCMVEEMPSFQDGDLMKFLKYVQENLRYPEIAQEYGIQGKVYVRFTVAANGSIINPIIIRGVDPLLDAEAIRVIKTTPRWRPGKQRGKPVNVEFTIPLTFRLVGNHQNYANEERVTEQLHHYYRARQFYAPIYSSNEVVEQRTDFRKTIYWNPMLTTDSTGTGRVEFYTSDELTTFRSTAEGIDSKGEIGRNEFTFYTKKPVSVDARIPRSVNFSDTIAIPVTFKNTTPGALTGKVRIEYPAFLTQLKPMPQEIAIPANETVATYLEFAVQNKRDTGILKILFEADSSSDAITSAMTSNTYGLPRKISYSGGSLNNLFKLSIPEYIPGSLQAEVVVYPSLESSLTSTIKALIREPHGCFEQVSATTYPNIMVLQYLKDINQHDKKTEEEIIHLITEGYKLMKAHETPTGGFDWFGKSPGHEGLTAFGLMAFYDMKSVCSVVDDKMVDRAQTWLLSRRDYNGGFKIASGKYGFSNNATLLNNSYIVYALSEIGIRNIQQEFERAYQDNINRNDTYRMALVANAALNLKDTAKANNILVKLKKQITEHGLASLKSETSITGSREKSLSVETVSLISLALLKYQQLDEPLLQLCVRYIIDSREFGSFYSTQASILGLKVLSKYFKTHADLLKPGIIAVSFNGGQTRVESYDTKQREPLVIQSLDDNFKVGDNHIDVDFKETIIPADFKLNVNYTTYIPTKSLITPIVIETTFKQKSVRRAETIRMAITIRNTENMDNAMTVVAINIPCGFSFQPWQLKELQEKYVFDFYEIMENKLFIYFRTLEAKAVRTINLDLKAEIPGVYRATLSSCYLYYTPEWKSYGEPVVLEIKK